MTAPANPKEEIIIFRRENIIQFFLFQYKVNYELSILLRHLKQATFVINILLKIEYCIILLLSFRSFRNSIK